MKNANPVSWRCAALIPVALLALVGCGRNGTERALSVPASPHSAAGADAKAAGVPVRYTFEVVATTPHDRGAFTQGLVFRNGGFLESTGLNGQSSLREVELKTGRVLKQVSIAPQYFGEGLAVIGDRAFLLTWQHGKGFVYDADTFRLEREFTYTGEGWGLTTDGRSLILSDGTARLRFLDPATFVVTRTVEVTSEGKPVEHLNELEFVRGEVFANVWMENEILRIDPATGVVVGVIDCSGLLPRTEIRPDTDVLNGIAYEATTDRLFLTGKRWPKIYEVRLKVKP